MKNLLIANGHAYDTQDLDIQGKVSDRRNQTGLDARRKKT